MTTREKRDPAACFVDVLRVCAGDAVLPPSDVGVRKLVTFVSTAPVDLTLSPMGRTPGAVPLPLRERGARSGEPSRRRHPLWIWVDVADGAVRVSVRVADRAGDSPVVPSGLPDQVRERVFLVLPVDVACPHGGHAARRLRRIGPGIVVCETCGRSRVLDAALVVVAVDEQPA